MSSPCYLRLTLHGHVKDSAAMALLTSQLVQEGFDSGEGWTATEQETVAAFRKDMIHCAATGTNPTFEMHECNYGNIEDTEAFLQDQGIAYQISHGSNSEYDGTASAWNAGDYEQMIETDSGELVVEVSVLRRALDAEDPVEVLRQIIDNCDFAAGKTLPTFSVGGDLVEEVAVCAARLALNIKEKAA